MIGLEAVWSALARLQERVLDAPTLERGVVLSDGSVQLDSDSSPLATVPWVLGNPLIPGQRVLTMAWRGYRAALGSASVPAVPSGSLQAWAGITGVPAGWLLADGRVLNIADYPVLSAVLGTRYGGNGATTFGIPDLRGRVAFGQLAGTFGTVGATGGEETHTLTESEMPRHVHNTDTGLVNAYGAGTPTPAAYSAGGLGFAYNTAYATSFTGGGGAHNNLPPYIVVNYLIKI